MNRFICIHGHFYQPPRENPWLEEVELQDSAYPYHDWNERITAECYAPNAASRILDAEQRIIDIVNNYVRMSFDVGPTLLSWMERRAPEVYQAIIAADRETRRRYGGHGSALAQVYNHMIMPLANRRDKWTQVVWGIKDFQHRFHRVPEGMWLPETAVDLETLEMLAEAGIRFTILAPHQARRVRKIGGRRWRDTSGGRIDPRHPYLCRLPSGRTITLFFYDGPISRDVAFGGLLNNGEQFAHRLVDAFSSSPDEAQLVHIATDGETYGHHHRFGDMALAYCLYTIESRQLATITNYGQYLDEHPPTHQVEIFENTSWSCAHGVERWRSDCGCHSSHPEWTQRWRAPLRAAMDWLRDELAALYERAMTPFTHDPWRVRDAYIDVILDRRRERVEAFLHEHMRPELAPEEKVTILKLLEMQRHALLMYTSCGWFFDEISGIETIQVMQYAARAMQLAEEIGGVALESHYIQMLERAPSNVAEYGNGARVYEKLVKPTRLDLLRVAAHYAVSSLFEEYPETVRLYCYTTESALSDRMHIGNHTLAIGKAHVRSEITWEEGMFSFATLHLGDHHLNGGVRPLAEEAAFATMREEIKAAFLKSDIPEVIRLMDKHFGSNNYSFWHLFKDEQRKILAQILQSTLDELEAAFQRLYEDSSSIMQFLHRLQIPLPKALAAIVELVLNAQLRRWLAEETGEVDRLRELAAEIKKWSVSLDEPTLSFAATRRIEGWMQAWAQHPDDVALLEQITTSLDIFDALSLDLDLWKAQNIYFAVGKAVYEERRQRAERGDEGAKRWIDAFVRLGDVLGVKMASNMP